MEYDKTLLSALIVFFVVQAVLEIIAILSQKGIL